MKATEAEVRAWVIRRVHRVVEGEQGYCVQLVDGRLFLADELSAALLDAYEQDVSGAPGRVLVQFEGGVEHVAWWVRYVTDPARLDRKCTTPREHWPRAYRAWRHG